MSVYLPIWAVVAGVGGGFWYMGNKWVAVAIWVVSAVMAGFISHPVLTSAIDSVKGLV